jgi:hypothetical protein
MVVMRQNISATPQRCGATWERLHRASMTINGKSPSLIAQDHFGFPGIEIEQGTGTPADHYQGLGQIGSGPPPLRRSRRSSKERMMASVRLSPVSADTCRANSSARSFFMLMPTRVSPPYRISKNSRIFR